MGSDRRSMLFASPANGGGAAGTASNTLPRGKMLFGVFFRGRLRPSGEGGGGGGCHEGPELSAFVWPKYARSFRAAQ